MGNLKWVNSRLPRILQCFINLMMLKHVYIQWWRQEVSDRGLTLPTRGLKYGFQGIVNAKNLPQNSFSPSDGG